MAVENAIYKNKYGIFSHANLLSNKCFFAFLTAFLNQLV